MALIDDNDVQLHLPVDKLQLSDIPDSLTQIYLDVERVIMGSLSGTFAPLTLASWTTPDETPEYIRAIGGRLGAALLYRNRLAQEDPDDPQYAQNKYLEAMTMLNLVISGAVVLPEVDEVVDTGAHLTAANYTATEPVFTMDREF